MKTVIGMGNALTDILVNLPSDDVLARLGLPRGSMTLVDADAQRRISDSVAGLPDALSVGGSAANTIRAFARLGGRAGFTGCVGRDSTGDFFESALVALGIEPFVFRGGGESGRCVSLISPDGERTMVTSLGAAMELSAGVISPSLFRGYDCLYLEGYLVQNHELIATAARTARQAGLKVAIDLASFNVVASNLEFLHSLVSESIDILFANEDEARAFTLREEPLDALGAISAMTELAVVKTGASGAFIRRGDEVVRVGVMESARRIDTTGAGDFYAAGFLYGLSEGLSLRQCGTIGAIAAGKVIEVVGTTFGDGAWADIARLVADVRTGQYLF